RPPRRLRRARKEKKRKKDRPPRRQRPPGRSHSQPRPACLLPPPRATPTAPRDTGGPTPQSLPRPRAAVKGKISPSSPHPAVTNPPPAAAVDLPPSSASPPSPFSRNPRFIPHEPAATPNPPLPPDLPPPVPHSLSRRRNPSGRLPPREPRGALSRLLFSSSFARGTGPRPAMAAEEASSSGGGEEGSGAGAGGWTREQEKAFENALATVDEEEGEAMWDKIADAVEGKTPEEVRRHYELLVEDVDGIEA
uniref:Myb-like domain-containing protein n=1 Tax=Aegilops tauschii subsp. strangulata TaxID=200361 RepID=A0A453DFV9_AEGTS